MINRKRSVGEEKERNVKFAFYKVGSETSAVSDGTTDLLESVIVYDLNGNGIPISDLWKDRKAVVAFAHVVLCRTRAAYLASGKDTMDAAGVALVIIGPGSVDQAKVFSEQTKFKGGVFLNLSYIGTVL
ncbi:hypothetical protein SASPL_155227 [Salvia splendens]|uniref:Uncharacterized protein n=1 Tax=Salvia splendens TaxID=180675 RepID=A0A8X8W1H1_SALSN|nr:hypothetical protein SASPL_155227 [Salvia splendens]